MNVTLFTPYQKQKEFINNFIASDDLFGVVVAPRGSGKTLLGINMLLFWLLDNPGKKAGWISPVYSQAKNVFDQITKAAKDIIESSNRMETTMTFINGSTIKFLSGDSPDSIRGFRFNYVVIDEAAFIKELTIDQIILPTLNPNGKKCLIISTPKGRNHFFKWYSKPDVVSQRFKLQDCPYIKQELIDQAKSSLPVDIFRQEFEAAFVDSSNDVFTNIHKVAFLGSYEEGRGQDVYCGIDTGLSDDSSVLTLISPIGKVLHIESIRQTDINTVGTVFSNVMKQFNIIGGYIETNGIGRATYDLLKNQFRKVKPFTTNINNKTDMVRKLISDIETMTIELPSEELCPALHTEFGQYTYKLSPTGKMSFGHMSGGHDDHIDSLMLANYSRNQFMNKKPISIGSINRVKPSFGAVRY